MSTPPPVGKTLSVKVDQDLYDDLLTIMSAGMNQSDAVRTAVRLVAGTYRAVWAAGHTPHGIQPIIDAFFIAPYDAGQTTADRARSQAVPRPYRAPVTPRPTAVPRFHTPGTTASDADQPRARQAV
ncbi:hypothetical protein GTY23_41580 [Streptomyces sp. SID5998]|nr:hypothetical protein [Streptomyces sp. SID5998]